MAHQKVLELSGPVQTYRQMNGTPECVVEWVPGSLMLGYQIELGAPVLRTIENGEEKLFVSYRAYGHPENERFILFEDLSPEDQSQVRQHFPDCHLLMTAH